MAEQNYKLNQFAQEIEQKMRRESFVNHYYYESEYLNKHNRTCPLCKRKIKKKFPQYSYRSSRYGDDSIGRGKSKYFIHLM